MELVSTETVCAAVEILGECENVNDEVERRIRSLVAEELTMIRLIDIIPEAFGWVTASHLPGASAMTLPTTFSVKDAAGEWQSFPIKNEPIFVDAIKIAQHIFHNGPRHIFKNNADRSGLLDAVSKFLDKGGCLEGSTGSLTFFGLPASLYDQTQGSMSHDS